MVAFYRNLLEGGMNKAQALRKAQLYILREHIDPLTMRRTDHPYYWAPFVLYGDWR